MFPDQPDDVVVGVAGNTAADRMVRLEDHAATLGGVKLAQHFTTDRGAVAGFTSDSLPAHADRERPIMMTTRKTGANTTRLTRIAAITACTAPPGTAHATFPDLTGKYLGPIVPGGEPRRFLVQVRRLLRLVRAKGELHPAG